jgi:hypothetical protein
MLNKLISSSLRVKLLAIPAIALVLVFLVMGLLLRGQLIKTFAASEQKQVEYLSVMLLDTYKNKQKALMTCARTTVLNESFHDGYFVTRTKNYDFLKSELKNASCDSVIDDFLAINNDGSVMFRMAAGSADTAAFNDILNKVLSLGQITDRAGQLTSAVFTELVKVGDGYKVVSAAPMLDGKNITGALFLVTNISTGFLEKHKERLLQGSEVSIATADSVVASTIPELS